MKVQKHLYFQKLNQNLLVCTAFLYPGEGENIYVGGTLQLQNIL